VLTSVSMVLQLDYVVVAVHILRLVDSLHPCATLPCDGYCTHKRNREFALYSNSHVAHLRHTLLFADCAPKRLECQEASPVLSLRLLEEGGDNFPACGYIPSLVSRHGVDALPGSIGGASVEINILGA
jgi:hypothetical protein